MSKEVFFNLLRKYLEGRCTEEERRIVEQWYGMLDDDELPGLQEAELEEIGKKLWERVDHATLVKEKPDPRKTSIRRLWPAVAIAASFIGIAMVATWALLMVGDTPNAPAFTASADRVSVVKKTNYTASPLTIHLPDSSMAILQPNATLTYPVSFTTERREVIIQGEGFFDVKKDAAWPFYVYSDRLVTHVVGTSFIVKAQEHTGQSEVTVLTGRVLVTHHEDEGSFYDKLVGSKETVELTPNFKAIYREATNSLLVTIADDPVPLSRRDGAQAADFVFNGTPVRDVLELLNSTYGIRVRAGDEIDRCTFTGDLSGQNLYEKLDFICQAIGTSYAVGGTEIILKGGNCQ